MKKNLLGLVFIMIFFLLASCTLFTESSSASSESTSSSENTSSSDVSSSSSTTSQTASSSTISSTTISSTSTSSSSSTSSTISSSSSSSSLYSIYESTDLELISNGSYAEGVYAVFTKVTGATSYNAYYKLSTDSDYTKVDSELVRDNRVDIVGLKSNTSYDVKIVPSNASGEMTAKAKSFTETTLAYDRSGYAFFNATAGVGAYNDDGTLKTNAVIVYVSDATKNTVTATLNGKTYTGLSSILQYQYKSSYPLVIRILGTIKTTAWNEIIYKNGTTNSGGLLNDTNTSLVAGNSYTESAIINSGTNSMSDDVALGITKLNGLTNKISGDTYTLNGTTYKSYDSYFNMLDISTAQNVTVEGIGTDAMLYQFGFTWKSCSNIEVRNLTFDDNPEDACSFQGSTTSTTYDGFSSKRIWVHNNTFNEGNNKWDVCYEQDKHEGDGATDIKKVSYVTISYNHYYKNHKTGLVGGGDSDKTAAVTFHHNFYDQCNSRLPLGRQANMHMYNNYYYGSTGTNMSLRGNAYAFIEACYFEGCNNPISITTTSSYTPAAKVFNSIFDNCKGTNQGTVVTSRTTAVSNGNTFGQKFDTSLTLFYYDSINEKTKVTYLSTAEVAKSDCINYSGVLKK